MCVYESDALSQFCRRWVIFHKMSGVYNVPAKWADRGFPRTDPLLRTLGPRQPWQTAQHPSAIGQVHALINDFALVWIQTDFPWPKTTFNNSTALFLEKTPEKKVNNSKKLFWQALLRKLFNQDVEAEGWFTLQSYFLLFVLPAFMLTFVLYWSAVVHFWGDLNCVL